MTAVKTLEDQIKELQEKLDAEKELRKLQGIIDIEYEVITPAHVEVHPLGNASLTVPEKVVKQIIRINTNSLDDNEKQLLRAVLGL